MSEIDKEVFGETEQTQQAIVESVRGTITRIDEDKIYDLTEEEVKIIADIIENGTWNTEGTAECANDCKLIIDERTYYYHSECGTFNDKENNQNLSVTGEEKESINAILAQYITLWFRVEECAIYKGEEVIDQLEIADARSEDPDDCLKVQLWIIR